jgi:hypothetical protein
LPPVRFRPWLQAFRDYAFDRRPFGAAEIRAQINAAERFGSNGWMLWNPRNVYSRDGLTDRSRARSSSLAARARPAQQDRRLEHPLVLPLSAPAQGRARSGLLAFPDTAFQLSRQLDNPWSIQ